MKKTYFKKKVFPFLGGLAFIGLTFNPLAHATDDFPKSTMTMVVPYPPGGPTDVVSRSVAMAMSDIIGKTVIVDNKPGASGMIGASHVARAKPDGYTFLANASIHVINPHIYENVSFDAIGDFEPITQLADVPLVLVVPKSSDIKNVEDLVDKAKQSKEGLNFGSAGIASAQHLSSEFLKQLAGFDATHVPYQGSSPALTDLASGQLDFMFDSMPSAMPFIQSGELKPIAVSTTERVPALEGIPTMQEAGYSEFETSTWYGLWAPKGTPKPIVEKLANYAQEALQKPNIIEQYKSIGAIPVGSEPEDFVEYSELESEKWGSLIRNANIPKQ